MSPFTLWIVTVALIIGSLSAALVLALIITRGVRPPRCHYCGGRLIVADYDTIVCEKCNQEHNLEDLL